MDSAERTWTMDRSDWLRLRQDIATAIELLTRPGTPQEAAVAGARNLKAWLRLMAEKAS